MSTLAEIVAEGERLEAARVDTAGNYSAQVAAEGALIDFFLAHYGRLLAVAAAAVEMREALETLDYRKATGRRLLKSLAAFDAAAREPKP